MVNKRFEKIAFYFLLGALFFTPISAYISIPLMIFSLFFFLFSRKTFSLNLLDKFQLALLGAVLLSSIFAVNKIHSFYAGSAFIAYLLAFFLAKGLFDTEEKLESLVKVLGILVLTVSIIGISQYFTNFSFVIKGIPVVTPMDKNGRIASICYNTLILASFLGFSLPILIAFFIKGKNRIFFGCSSIAGFLAFLLTFGRGPTIGLIGALFLFFLLLRKRAVAILTLLISIGLVLSISPLRMRFIQTFSCNNDFSRIIAFHAGIKMWSDNSILTGVGIHNFYLLFEKYALPGYSRGPHYIHSMYLNFLVDAGIIGFLSLITVLLATVEWARKKYKRLKDKSSKKWMLAGLFASFSGLLIHNFVDNTIYVVGLGILFWMGMGIVSSIDSNLIHNKT